MAALGHVEISIMFELIAELLWKENFQFPISPNICVPSAGQCVGRNNCRVMACDGRSSLMTVLLDARYNSRLCTVTYSSSEFWGAQLLSHLV